MSITTTRAMTAAELWEMGPEYEHFELDEGELREMSPAGPWHGWIAMELGRRLGNFVVECGLGFVFAAETGFQLAEHTVRAPDVAFVRKQRLESGGLPRTGFFPGAPDLAVEVLSPRDREHPGDLLHRVSQFLLAGAVQVWVVDPFQLQVMIYKSETIVQVLGVEQTLSAESLLPGFACPVGELFPA